MIFATRCPAKLNIFLAVGPPDRRGYHPLRTRFQAVSLFDDLTAEVSEEDTFESDVNLPEVNTVTRALSLIRELVPLPPVRISLTKRIPCEAGLGGGSSDAAGMIRLAMAITGTNPPLPELHSVASAVGADVAFFLVGGTALAEGYGDLITQRLGSAEAVYLVVKPAAGTPTIKAYKSLDAIARRWLDWDELAPGHNDFESVAPAESLTALAALRRMEPISAGLTGSGSAIFGEFESVERAQWASRQLPPDLSTWVTRSLTSAECLSVQSSAGAVR